MLSNASKYAVRAVLFLGLNAEEGQRFGVAKISEELEIPQPFLAQLLRNLASKKIVSSSKGPGGGFFLNEDNLKLHILDVINYFDGGEIFEECFLGLAKCNDDNPCPVHFLAKPLKDKIQRDFKEKTIADYVVEIKKNGTVLSLKQLGV